MPVSVERAAPTAVMPASMCGTFVREQQVPVTECGYPDGSSRRNTLAASSRKRWRLPKRLTPAEPATLRDFHEARKGAHEPLYFYDPANRIRDSAPTRRARRRTAATLCALMARSARRSAWAAPTLESYSLSSCSARYRWRRDRAA